MENASMRLAKSLFNRDSIDDVADIDNIIVDATITPDSNEINVTVSYEIVGIPSPSQRVDVILQPARV